MATNQRVPRTAAELYKVTFAIENAQKWCGHAYRASEEEGEFIEQAMSELEKALVSLRSQHNVS